MFKINFNFLKKIKLKLFPFYWDKEIKLVFKILNKDTNQVAARFVGGCVRKYLSGEKIDDIDIATIHSTDEIKKRFSETNFKVVESGIEHGTITIISQKFKLELTTLRKDIKTDGRHAEVEFTDDWQLDSERRDFTINAIYLDINGKIFDPQMGTEDLKNKNVKFIGDPQKRIEEDYLRIIRFIRFKLKYNTKIEKTTEEAVKLNLDGIKKISKERILSELFKILKVKTFYKINNSKELKEIFTLIFPEFLYLRRLDRLKKVSKSHEVDLNTLLAVLLLDDKDNHQYFAHKYKISNNLKEGLDLFSDNFKNLNKNKNFLKQDLLKNIYLFGKDHLKSLNMLNFTCNNKITSENYLETLKIISQSVIPKFEIDGNYLIELGMKEGSSLGRVLKLAENEWMNNNFKISKSEVIKLIQSN